MAKNVAKFASSNIGVGITGELGNTINKEPKVYYSIFFADEDRFITKVLEVKNIPIAKNKQKIAEELFTDLLKEI